MYNLRPRRDPVLIKISNALPEHILLYIYCLSQQPRRHMYNLRSSSLSWPKLARIMHLPGVGTTQI